MSSTRSLAFVVFLALVGATPAYAQTLNLSQDLVALGIASANMVPNQPALDAGPLFVQGVDYAKTHGITTVIANPGAYYFLSLTEINAHFALRNIDNMTIDLQGADLIFTHPLYLGLIVYYSTNVTLENFTADYQPLPFTQVRVVAVDVPNNKIQYVVEPGWPDTSTFNTFSPFPGAPVPVVYVHMFRSGRRVLGRLFSQLPLGGGGNLAIVDTDPGTHLGDVRAGDVAVVAVRSMSDAVNTNHCNGCTLRNITVFSSANNAVSAAYTQNSVMERVYAIPKPGTDRLAEGSAGIFMYPFSGPNNQMRLSRAIRTFDDGICVYGLIIGTVQSQSTPRRLVIEGSGGPSVLGVGDTVPNGTPVNFQRLSDGAMLGPAVIVSQSAATTTPLYRITFDFDHDLPAGLVGSVMYSTDPNQNGANSVLERNLVQEPFGRMYIGGIANSIARGNYIRRTALSGIFLVDSTAPGDPPSSTLTSMTLNHNVIDGTNMTSNWWWFQFGGISSVTLTTAYDLMTGQPMSNLNIANNFIADSGRSGVWLGNTSGGSITGNYILNPNVRPDLANAYQPRLADATRPLVVDTTSSGITTANNTIDTTSGVTFVSDTAYRELAAYAPGSTMRLNAYNIGSLVSPAATLTDADGVVTPIAIQSTTAQALDVQLPAGAALGGAYVTLTSGGAKYFGTLFIDSQDNIPAVNGCTYELSVSSTSVPGSASGLPILVVTQAECAYQVLASDTFVNPGSGGTGTAVITVGFATNTGSARNATIEIAGQPIALTQAALPPGTRRPGDFDGDGKADVTVFRPSIGVWYVLRSGTNYTGYAAYQWGVTTDTPVPGDYDGDGKGDIAVYRSSTGIWYVLLSSTSFSTFVSYQWGVSTDVPVPGDYDGDGKTDVAIYRPSAGTWFVLKSTTNSSTYVSYQWGLSTDTPVAGDYDGDGKTDAAIYRPSSGTWFVLLSSTNGATYAARQWGLSTDLPVPGDYDGDGKQDSAVYRPSTGTWWVLLSSTNGSTSVSYQWGLSTDTPVPADYDGDAKTDVAIYRPATGTWYVLRSSAGNTPTSYQWGVGTDIPVLKRP